MRQVLLDSLYLGYCHQDQHYHLYHHYLNLLFLKHHSGMRQHYYQYHLHLSLRFQRHHSGKHRHYHLHHHYLSLRFQRHLAGMRQLYHRYRHYLSQFLVDLVLDLLHTHHLNRHYHHRYQHYHLYHHYLRLQFQRHLAGIRQRYLRCRHHLNQILVGLVLDLVHTYHLNRHYHHLHQDNLWFHHYQYP